MTTPFEFADLTTLVRPQRVAVVGASDRPGSFGYSTYHNVRNNSAVPGGAVPVNPRYRTVLGDPCYERVSDVPGERIDVAIVLVAAEQALDVARDCAKAGVGHLVVLSSGFSETDEDGRRLQDELVELCRASNIRVYGPNSPGLANIADRILLSMSPVAGDDVTAGPIGLVTQGGGIGRALMQWMDRGLGIGLWCSPGNESDLDIADFVNEMVRDDRIRVIGAVVEGFSAGPKFLAVAERAAAAGKPIVILKIGRSEYGRQSAASHTASIAGNDAVASAVFAQHGVVRVNDVDELGATLAIFAAALDTDSGRDVAATCVYSFSGGAASLAADMVGAGGLRLAVFEPATRAALVERAPAFGFVSNPVDLTTKVFTDSELNREVFSLICRDPNVGSVLFAMPADYGDSTVSVTRDVIDIAGRTNTLLIPVWMSPRRGGGYDLLEQAGLTPFDGLLAAVTALRRFAEWRAPAVGVPEQESALTGDAYSAQAGGAVSERALSYHDALDRIGRAGLRVPRERFATDSAAAARAADEIGGPVALKLSAPGLVHKTEVGGVRLGVRGGPAAAAAFDQMCAPERLAGYGVVADGVFVQEMIPDGLDLLLSAHRDEVFGPVVTIGAGGIATEIDKDVAHLAIPFTDEQAERALRALRIWPRLAGFRGAPGCNLGTLLAAVRSLATAFVAAGDELAEIEINPLRAVMSPDSTDLVVLDAVVLAA